MLLLHNTPEYAVALKNAYRQFPAKNSSLDIDFINNRQRVAGVYGSALDGVTFTRSTTATYFGADGTLQTAAINAPRFEYDPVSLRPLGLLIEESRSNSIRNNTMVGAVAGTPGTLPTNWGEIGAGLGTLTRTISFGTENGISYIDFRFAGTTSTISVGYAFESIGGIVASNGQTWTSSFYTKISAGSTSNTTVSNLVEQRTSAGVFLQNDTSPITLTNNLARSVYSKTLNAGATVGQVRNGFILTFSSSVAIDITIRVGLPQLELGSFATSVIPTTGTTATRGADVASMTGANFSSWYNQISGTCSISADSATTTSYRTLLQIDDTTTDNRLYIDMSSTGIQRSVSTVGGGNQCLIVLQGISVNTKFNVSAAYALNDCAAAINGNATGLDTSATMPTVTQLLFGYDSANRWCGHISRLTYYPKRLPNNLLQYLSRLTA